MRPVDSSVRVMFVPGKTAPDWSVTLPLNSAVADCPNAETTETRSTTATETTRTHMSASFGSWDPLPGRCGLPPNELRHKAFRSSIRNRLRDGRGCGAAAKRAVSARESDGEDDFPHNTSLWAL